MEGTYLEKRILEWILRLSYSETIDFTKKKGYYYIRFRIFFILIYNKLFL